MKKTNNVKANKVNMNKVNNNAKANNETKTTAAQAKANNNAEQFTVQPYDGISVTVENKTLDKMKSWAYHLTKDLDSLFIDLNYAVEDGTNIDFIPYTEDELNEMIAKAGFAINFFDPNDTEIYRDYYNAYGCCRCIIDNCITLTYALHGNYDGLGWVKPKYTKTSDFDYLSTQIDRFYHALYTVKSNIEYKLITTVPYSCTELCSISGTATHMLNVLNKYDCSDLCNVELIKYFCTEAINIVNNLLDRIITDDNISCSDNQKACMFVQLPKTKCADIAFEYDDF